MYSYVLSVQLAMCIDSQWCSYIGPTEVLTLSSVLLILSSTQVQLHNFCVSPCMHAYVCMRMCMYACMCVCMCVWSITRIMLYLHNVATCSYIATPQEQSTLLALSPHLLYRNFHQPHHVPFQNQQSIWLLQNNIYAKIKF